MKFTKGQIDRLGDTIRQETGNLSENTLYELQEYRTSHKKALSEVFNIICQLSRQIQGRSITTYRIKRFHSIISKLNRLPEQRFSRMGDIAGCRCILDNDDDVYKLNDLLSQRLFIKKVNDHIAELREDGYRSLHIYACLPDDPTIIEIQLRSINDHNWATLVEITDILYDTRLKEYGEPEDFAEFHKLLSFVDDLTVDEQKQIVQILRKHRYVERLSEVFSRNYIQVRKQWLGIQNKTTHKYFLIESNKEEIPSIESFSNFNEAEEKYFNLYKDRPDANAVLTHLSFPNYNQISIAYSNYILTFHDFLNDCYKIYESLILLCLQKGELWSFKKYLELYNEMVYKRISNLVQETREMDIIIKSSRNAKLKIKEKEWRNDIQKQINVLNDNAMKFQRAFNHQLPKKGLSKFFVRLILSYITDRYRSRFRKTFS